MAAKTSLLMVFLVVLHWDKLTILALNELFNVTLERIRFD